MVYEVQQCTRDAMCICIINIFNAVSVEMEGEAKRDYPATISYQSPWFDKYSLIEDHFARVNTALTRGKPIANVGVIHPIESYWLHWGPAQTTHEKRTQLDENYTFYTINSLLSSIFSIKLSLFAQKYEDFLEKNKNIRFNPLASRLFP